MIMGGARTTVTDPAVQGPGVEGSLVEGPVVEGPVIEGLDAAVYVVPTDAPEADGTAFGSPRFGHPVRR